MASGREFTQLLFHARPEMYRKQCRRGKEPANVPQCAACEEFVLSTRKPLHPIPAQAQPSAAFYFCAGSWGLASSKAGDGFGVLQTSQNKQPGWKTWRTSITAAYNINSVKNNVQIDQYESCLLRAWGWLKRKGALGTEGVKTQSVTSYFHQVNTKSLKFESIWQDVCQPWAVLWRRGNLAEFLEMFLLGLTPLSDGCLRIWLKW